MGQPVLDRSNLEHAQPATGRPIQDLFCIEIFAGTGRLTAAIKALGLRNNFGVDLKLPPKFRSPIVKYDLLNSEHAAIVKSLIAQPECIFIHYAPSCGTSSRARLIQRRERSNPPILRTDAHPNGIPGLSGILLAKVTAANSLYAITCDLVRWCIQHAKYFAVENPGRSFMWDTDPFKLLMQEHPCLNVYFHHCRYGSARRKLTRFWHNVPSFQLLEAYCQNDHEHEPWGQNPLGYWSTSEETAYPWELCRSIGARLLLQLKNDDYQCSAPVFALQEASLGSMRASTDLQPRKGIPPMVSEFKQIISCLSSEPKPYNSRLLSTPFGGDSASANTSNSVTYGIHRSPEEFVAEALALGHPTRVQSTFPDEVKEVVSNTLDKDPGDLAKERTEEIRRWISKSSELDSAESELKSSMSDRRREVLTDKKLLLLDSLLNDAGHYDKNLVQDITQGFDLTGMLPASNVFSKNIKPAVISCIELRRVADLSRAGMLQTVRSSGDQQLDRELHEATLKEVERGFLVGPIKPGSLPAGATLTRRFGVKQRTKTRPIDDYKASFVNASVTQTESTTVHTIDHVASMTACLLRESSKKGRKMELVAKTWDLAHAYKQVPLSDAAFASDSCLAVYNPVTDEPEVFQQRVLPFGSVASVTAFLRISHALWMIGTKLLKLLWSAYFDDFLSINESALGRHTDLIITSPFSILGWKLSQDKLLPYDSTCKVLGVQFDFKMSGSGLTLVTNTNDRVGELCESIDHILKKGVLKRNDGEKLRGRLIFATGQLFGRRARNLVRMLSLHIQGNSAALSSVTVKTLEKLRALISNNLPRKIMGPLSSHIHVYVDASFDENGYSGLGGVAYHECGKVLGFFSEKNSHDLVRKIKSQGQVTIIQELEMLALLIAVELWCTSMRNHRFVIFTDSEAVRGSFLKSWSANANNHHFLERVFAVEEMFECQIWLERVPSQSNPADVLSRQVVFSYQSMPRSKVNLEEIFTGWPFGGVTARPAN